MNTFSETEFRRKFPILQKLNKDSGLIYFDNAATTQKYKAVIKTSQNFYQESNANVHRGSHFLSAKATESFEIVRLQVQKLINAKSAKEIIWTKGTTEAINLVAQCFGLTNLSAGDEIVVSQAEHHANIVPWQNLANQIGVVIKVLPLDKCGRIDLVQAQRIISSKCKLLAINHISNVIGKINPIEQLIALAKGVGAKTLIDGAQSIAHTIIDVQALDCDFYVFSAHKMYGPTGIGVLFGKQELLEKMPPYQFGGEMIKKVSFTGTTYNTLPHKFEAGTPNIVGVVGLGSCLELFSPSFLTPMTEYEQRLCQYAYQGLTTIPGLEFLVEQQPDIPLFSFTINDLHHHDVATFLDSKGIAVRSGHHCAMPLMDLFKLDGSVRVSLAPYNTFAEIDELIKQLKLLVQGDETDQTSTSIKPSLESINTPDQTQIINLFNKANSWDLKHRQIMLLAKQLPRIDKQQRTDDDLINGCESNSWLQVSLDLTTKQLSFMADSDAKVIRGLMVIILSAYQHKTAEQIIAFDISNFFSQLGLMQHLSPSRGNGVRAIVERIEQLAASYL
ncbi:SufS family cysteine desulfurase [Thalassomonas sp. M1454]|uniref:SufS family cysteine desulfurase n=1 Tax=Thalassomonas sp. M1454 TaxID=2594477 RepID=UPI0011814E9C|nr:SufS family cysteine desulfurase [Thalassomonas sp. M1454]TRX56548.1 SufS family cysteine desulfurase [Thalassomonas sp. M1454]